jgi:predicted Zn-dependent protease with MMP-like domain
MTRKEFEKIVQEALDSLPRAFKENLRNIDVVIDDRPARGAKKDLLGLYEGVPLEERTGGGYSFVMHDRITLFKQNIEKECKAGGKDVAQEVRHTLVHEIAHHFGISDDRLKELGVY